MHWPERHPVATAVPPGQDQGEPASTTSRISAVIRAARPVTVLPSLAEAPQPSKKKGSNSLWQAVGLAPGKREVTSSLAAVMDSFAPGPPRPVRHSPRSVQLGQLSARAAEKCPDRVARARADRASETLEVVLTKGGMGSGLLLHQCPPPTSPRTPHRTFHSSARRPPKNADLQSFFQAATIRVRQCQEILSDQVHKAEAGLTDRSQASVLRELGGRVSDYRRKLVGFAAAVGMADMVATSPLATTVVRRRLLLVEDSEPFLGHKSARHLNSHVHSRSNLANTRPSWATIAASSLAGPRPRVEKQQVLTTQYCCEVTQTMLTLEKSLQNLKRDDAVLDVLFSGRLAELKSRQQEEEQQEQHVAVSNQQSSSFHLGVLAKVLLFARKGSTHGNFNESLLHLKHVAVDHGSESALDIVAADKKVFLGLGAAEATAHESTGKYTMLHHAARGGDVSGCRLLVMLAGELVKCDPNPKGANEVYKRVLEAAAQVAVTHYQWGCEHVLMLALDRQRRPYSIDRPLLPPRYELGLRTPVARGKMELQKLSPAYGLHAGYQTSLDITLMQHQLMLAQQLRKRLVVVCERAPHQPGHFDWARARQKYEHPHCTNLWAREFFRALESGKHIVTYDPDNIPSTIEQLVQKEAGQGALSVWTRTATASITRQFFQSISHASDDSDDEEGNAPVGAPTATDFALCSHAQFGGQHMQRALVGIEKAGMTAVVCGDEPYPTHLERHIQGADYVVFFLSGFCKKTSFSLELDLPISADSMAEGGTVANSNGFESDLREELARHLHQRCRLREHDEQRRRQETTSSMVISRQLRSAIQRGQLKRVRRRLEHFDDINARDKNGYTPLILAAEAFIEDKGRSYGNPDHFGVVQLLLAPSDHWVAVDLDAQDSSGNTALMAAGGNTLSGAAAAGSGVYSMKQSLKDLKGRLEMARVQLAIYEDELQKFVRISLDAEREGGFEKIQAYEAKIRDETVRAWQDESRQVFTDAGVPKTATVKELLVEYEAEYAAAAHERGVASIKAWEAKQDEADSATAKPQDNDGVQDPVKKYARLRQWLQAHATSRMQKLSEAEGEKPVLQQIKRTREVLEMNRCQIEELEAAVAGSRSELQVMQAALSALKKELEEAQNDAHQESMRRMAANSRRLQLTEILLEAGASAFVKNHDHFTALSIAQNRNLLAVADKIRVHVRKQKGSGTRRTIDQLLAKAEEHRGAMRYVEAAIAFSSAFIKGGSRDKSVKDKFDMAALCSRIKIVGRQSHKQMEATAESRYCRDKSSSARDVGTKVYLELTPMAQVLDEPILATMPSSAQLYDDLCKHVANGGMKGAGGLCGTLDPGSLIVLTGMQRAGPYSHSECVRRAIVTAASAQHEILRAPANPEVDALAVWLTKLGLAKYTSAIHKAGYTLLEHFLDGDQEDIEALAKLVWMPYPDKQVLLKAWHRVRKQLTPVETFVSVFAPPAIAAPLGTRPTLFLVDICAFALATRATVELRGLVHQSAPGTAAESIASAIDRGSCKISPNTIIAVEIGRTGALDPMLGAFEAEVTRAQFVWNGEASNAQFEIRCMPQVQVGRSPWFHAHVTALPLGGSTEDAVPVGTLRFQVDVVAQEQVSAIDPTHTIEVAQYAFDKS